MMIRSDRQPPWRRRVGPGVQLESLSLELLGNGHSLLADALDAR
jgi:hypothetical protein